MKRGARFLSLEGRELPGIRQIVPVASPPAATDWTVKVPGGQQWRVLTAKATLATDATVTSRLPQFALISPDGATVWRNGDAVTIVASHTQFLNGAVYSGAVVQQGDGNGSNLVLPPLWLPAGWSFGSHSNFLAAGDQWSAIMLWVEQLYTTDAILSGD